MLRYVTTVNEAGETAVMVKEADHLAVVGKLREALARCDSLLSLLFYRHSNSLRQLVGEDCYRDIDGAIGQARAECERSE